MLKDQRNDKQEQKIKHLLLIIIFLRYVKEWLGAVVSGGIVDIDRTGETFFLPVHRRSALTEATSGATNYTEFACGLPVLMKDFDQMPAAMKVGGKGIPGRFQNCLTVCLHNGERPPPTTTSSVHLITA